MVLVYAMENVVAHYYLMQYGCQIKYKKYIEWIRDFIIESMKTSIVCYKQYRNRTFTKLVVKKTWIVFFLGKILYFFRSN